MLDCNLLFYYIVTTTINHYNIIIDVLLEKISYIIKKSAVIVCVCLLIEFQRRETIIGRRVRRSYRDAKILETSVRIERREDGKREEVMRR